MPVPGMNDKVDGVLYDTMVVNAAAAGQTIQFFANTIGINGLVVTNMKQSGMLPQPERFLVRAIRVIPITQVAVDADLIINNTVAQFSILRKVITEWPSRLLPAGAGVPFLSDTNGIADTRSIYSLENPFVLEQQVNFSVDLFCGALIAGIGAPTLVQIVLDGDKYLGVV